MENVFPFTLSRLLKRIDALINGRNSIQLKQPSFSTPSSFKDVFTVSRLDVTGLYWVLSSYHAVNCVWMDLTGFLAVISAHYSSVGMRFNCSSPPPLPDVSWAFYRQARMKTLLSQSEFQRRPSFFLTRLFCERKRDKTMKKSAPLNFFFLKKGLG